jgi:hypothetical protein
MNDETPEEKQEPAEKTKLSRLEGIRKKIEQLKAREAVEEARKKTKERKEDSRRKVLYGVVFLAAERAGKIDKNMVHELMDQFLTADRDRIFLGLEPRGPALEQALPAPTPEPEPKQEKSTGYKPGSFEVHPDTEDL